MHLAAWLWEKGLDPDGGLYKAAHFNGANEVGGDGEYNDHGHA